MASERGLGKGLGKGLGALLGDAALQSQEGGSVSLPIAQVEPGLKQPRKRFDEESLADLADSIRLHGIIQPSPSGGWPPAIIRSSPGSGAGGRPSWPGWPRSRRSSLRPTTARSWSWASLKTSSGRT